MPVAVAQDGFGDLVEPAHRIEATEHVIVDGPRPVDGHKITAFVSINDGGDHAAAWHSWINVHAPNVVQEFQSKGGLRYAVSLADQHRGTPPFLGIAELWYQDRAAANRHLSELTLDPFMDLISAKLLPGVEVIGIA